MVIGFCETGKERNRRHSHHAATSLPKSPAAQRDHLSHSPSATGRKRSSNPNRRPCPSFSCPPGQPIPAQPLPRRPGWTPPKSSPYRWQTIASDTSRSSAIWLLASRTPPYTATGRVRLARADRRRPGRFRVVLAGKGAWSACASRTMEGRWARRARSIARRSRSIRRCRARHAMAVLQRGRVPGRRLRERRLLGSHEGFFAPFELACTEVAHPGENTLLVRCENDAICMGKPEDGRARWTKATSCTPPAGRAGTSRTSAGIIARPAWASIRTLARGAAAGSSSTTCSSGRCPRTRQAEAWIEVFNSDAQRRTGSARAVGVRAELRGDGIPSITTRTELSRRVPGRQSTATACPYASRRRRLGRPRRRGSIRCRSNCWTARAMLDTASAAVRPAHLPHTTSRASPRAACISTGADSAARAPTRWARAAVRHARRTGRS